MNHPQRGVFHNVSLSNMENILRRNLRMDRARECIFRESGGTRFEKFSTQRQPWWCPHGFDVCTSLPKKLWICHCLCLFLLNPKYYQNEIGSNTSVLYDKHF